MIFLNLICCSLAVALVTADLISDHDLNEYRLATKRYHRKIRSTESEGFVPLLKPADVKQEEEVLIPASGSVDEPSVQVAPNTSFLLDLPFPSHFLVSLQMLNLSLPFIDTTVDVPEDPPTPNFDLDEVIKNRQQFQPSPPDESPVINPAGGKSEVNLNGHTRRAINRIRHRIPARRLPKRSPQEPPVPANVKTPKFRSWNASKSAVGSRRLELYSKYRSTTTSRPKIKKFQSKLLSRRANATKPEIRKPSPVIESPVESTTENPSTALEQGGSSTEQPELSDLVRPSVSGTSNRFVFQSPDYQSFKTRTGGFRPIKTSINSDRFRPSIGPDRSVSSPPREKFISSPPEPLAPIISSGQSHDIATTTESLAAKFRFKPSTPLKPHHLSKYISQFEPSSSKQEGEEPTQIQKPDTKQIDLISPSGSNDESLVAATSTIVPITDFVPDLNFPSFELPGKDGSKSSTLPPPLSIEELIKKFTGKDLITDPPSVVSSSTPSTSSPSVQHPSPIQAESIDIVTTKTINASPSIPESGSFGDLEASLKQLLVVTASVPVNDKNQSAFIHLDVGTTTTPPTTSSTPASSSLTLPVLPLPNTSPATEKTVFSHPETSTVQSVTQNPSVPSGLELSKSAGISIVSIVNATSVSSDTTNLPVSVQRGPLDVSSFDNSFGSGAVQQGGFNFQSGFQQQQQQVPSGNFGGYSGGNFGGGGGGDVAGQQNPYFYGANLFTGPGGGGGGGAGQFNQNGFDASFGGTGGGQFAIQQPSGYQQSFSDFNPAALQASSQIQSTVPSQGFSSFSQGYPSFNLIQQQPQPYPSQSQQTYQLAQFQNYPQQQQQQQLYSPGGGQQQSYQLLAGNSPSNLYPVQLVQYQPQGSAFQQQPTGSVSLPQGSVSTAINPAQFGTLASGLQTSSFDSAGQTAGTASASPVSVSSVPVSSNSISTDSSSPAAAASPKEKSIDAAASQQVEYQLKPVSHSMFADTVAEASNSVQLISIGPELGPIESDSLKAGSKKSSYKRGLRSGYYP